MAEPVFRTLDIENYRGIRKLHLEGLRSINVLVGKNNCGKTSVLEAAYLLTGGNETNNIYNIARFRNAIGFDKKFSSLDMFYDLKYKNVIKISAVLQSNLFNSCILGENHPTTLLFFHEISKEEINRYFFEIANAVHLKAASTTVADYSYIVFPKNIGDNIQREIYFKKPELHSSSLFISVDETDFSVPKLLDDLITNRQEESIIEKLQTLEPRLDDIRLGTNDHISVGIKGISRLLPLSSLGEGANRILRLAVAVETIGNGILFVDEIDTGLHYTALCDMWRAVLAGTEATGAQVFATTHSDECIKALNMVLKEKYPDDLDNAPACMIRLEAGEEEHRAVYYSPDMIEALVDMDFEYR